MAVPPDYTLSRDAFGQLIFRPDGGSPVAVRPVRSFPISRPDQGLALLGPHGRELVWIETLDTLPSAYRKLIEEELAQREFRPLIERIIQASSWTTPSHWDVATDRGNARLTLNSEDDIRRLSGTSLLITDACGVNFVIRSVPALDRASRRILDHFL